MKIPNLSCDPLEVKFCQLRLLYSQRIHTETTLYSSYPCEALRHFYKAARRLFDLLKLIPCFEKPTHFHSRSNFGGSRHLEIENRQYPESMKWPRFYWVN